MVSPLNPANDVKCYSVLSIFILYHLSKWIQLLLARPENQREAAEFQEHQVLLVLAWAGKPLQCQNLPKQEDTSGVNLGSLDTSFYFGGITAESTWNKGGADPCPVLEGSKVKLVPVLSIPFL